jgi:hypothetical protein
MKNFDVKESSHLSRLNDRSEDNFDFVLATTLKRTSLIYTMVSPTALKMSGCQAWNFTMMSQQSSPRNPTRTTESPPRVFYTRRNIKRTRPNGNLLINPLNLKRGCKYATIGETEATVAAREKVQLIAPEWEAIRAAVNGIVYKPSDAPMNVLMGYQYALHHQGRRLLQ